MSDAAGAAQPIRQAARRLAVALLCALLALGAHGLRRRLIVSVLRDGPPGPAPRLGPAATKAEPLLPPATRVRVVLIDGLGGAIADGLPHMDRLCEGGLDLRVDPGFPTVSLPVEAVLWTGLTQTQSGILFRVKGLERVPAAALPARVPGSRAAPESHAFIAGSFGFQLTAPRAPAPGSDPSAFRPEEFRGAAREVVESDARLAFVHILRVDDAGHHWGSASPAYHEAARTADVLLGELVEAERARHGGTDTRWLVLADHGHLPEGGHGDAEAAVRDVRACLVGDLPPGLTAPIRTPVHMVDVSRALFDSLGIAPPAASSGRPLAAALVSPMPDGTLPRPTPARAVIAVLVLLAGLLADRRLRRGARGLARWDVALWLPLATVSITLLIGFPSLSRNLVFGRSLVPTAVVAWPGLVWLLAVEGRSLLGDRYARSAARSLTLPLALVLAALALTGGEAALGNAHAPFELPRVTGLASVWLGLFALGAGVIGTGLTANVLLMAPRLRRAARPAAPGAAARGSSDRSAPPGSADTAG